MAGVVPWCGKLNEDARPLPPFSHIIIVIITLIVTLFSSAFHALDYLQLEYDSGHDVGELDFHTICQAVVDTNIH